MLRKEYILRWYSMNKFIAPIVIAVITIIYGLGMSILLFTAVMKNLLPMAVAIFILIGPIVGAVLIIVVLIQRIKEIKGGEENAASKY